jgi:Ca-activated chloride channel family protein
MSAELIAAFVGILAVLGELWHAQRCRRIARLAFGRRGKPHRWTLAVPLLRVFALVALAWGLTELSILTPGAYTRQQPTSTVQRHLVLALDVSPSMQLKDAGPQHQQSRAQRASEIVSSIFERVDLEHTRMSVVAFYTGAKPVIVDTFDLAVMKNVIEELPLEIAFDPGKTNLLDGVRESVALARNWTPGSTTLLIVSDGDTVPDTGMPHLPPSIRDALVLGVGSSSAGIYIDGHLSRQDSSVLRQLAVRLGGNYFDANEKLVPSRELFAFARALSRRNDSRPGKREWALVAIGLGACLLAALPIALALAGSDWPPRASAARHMRVHPFRSVSEPIAH